MGSPLCVKKDEGNAERSAIVGMAWGEIDLSFAAPTRWMQHGEYPLKPARDRAEEGSRDPGPKGWGGGVG